MRTGQSRKAVPLLRRLVGPAGTGLEDQAPALRRELAGVLARSNSDRDWKEALTLLAENRVTNGYDVSDQRARAVVLAQRPTHRAEAMKLLEQSADAAPLEPTEAHLLGQLCDEMGQREKAREYFLSAVAVTPNALYVADYIRYLLRADEVGEARRWLLRLQRVEPHSARTIALEAEVRRHE
jgi:tetratricopeptide (TPR) repeat protein